LDCVLGRIGIAGIPELKNWEGTCTPSKYINVLDGQRAKRAPRGYKVIAYCIGEFIAIEVD
jgi:hypothetical protein